MRLLGAEIANSVVTMCDMKPQGTENGISAPPTLFSFLMHRADAPAIILCQKRKYLTQRLASRRIKRHE
jgi:hypothetical protein